MTAPPSHYIAGDGVLVLGTRRRFPVPLLALVAVILLGALLAGTSYYVRSSGGNFWGASQERAASPPHGKSRLAPSIFAKIPMDRADQNVAVAIEETSSAPRVLEQLSPEEARARNAAIQAAADVGPAARPLKVPLGDGIGYARALDCMTTAIYYEAANEPLEGQRAVAQVIINRSRHSVYPHTICAVVYQGWERKTGCQFSFTCDGSLRRVPVPALWLRARRVANMALSGLVYAPVGLATHYHADYVLPYWAPTLVKQTVIGRHIFYRWPGAWGTARSFGAAYDRNEPDMWAEMQTAGLAVSPAIAEQVETTSPAYTASRPVLMTNSAPALPMAAEPTTGQSKDRVYLMSRTGSAPKPQAPARRGVTGGAIMPSAVILPTEPPSRLPQDTEAAAPSAPPSRPR